MKKQIALIAVCAVLAICMFTAGCTSPTASPASSGPSSAAASTGQALTPSVTAVSPSATVTPTATPTYSGTPSNSPSGGSASGLTLMFFYRPTCPKCAATEPIITELQTKYAGKVSFVRINDDDGANADIISQNRVTIVPTVILLNHGVEVQRWVYPIDSAAVIAGQIDSQLNAG